MNATRQNPKYGPGDIRAVLHAPAAAAEVDAVAARLADRAESEGLLDVAYAETDSPFGPVLLAATPRGLVKLALPNQDREQVLGDLAGKVSPRILEQPTRLDEVRRELDLYFEG